MDTRAWRLTTWHPKTHVFEVDTPAMSSFKKQVVAGVNPSCASWSPVGADAREVYKLEQQLSQAGFKLSGAGAGAGAGAGRSSAKASVGIPTTAPSGAGNFTIAEAACLASVEEQEPAGGEILTGIAGSIGSDEHLIDKSSVPATAATTAGAGSSVHTSAVPLDQALSSVVMVGAATAVSEAEAAATHPRGNTEDEVPDTLWLLEGFIGYISREEGLALLSWMRRVSSRGSLLLMTAPPPPEEQQYNERYKQQLHGEGAGRVKEQQLCIGVQQQLQQQQLEQGRAVPVQQQQQQQQVEVMPLPTQQLQERQGDKGERVEPAGFNDGLSAMPPGHSGPAKEGPAVPRAADPAACAVAGESHADVKLHHAVYEEVEETEARVKAAGWVVVDVVMGEVLAATYGVQKAQTILKAVVATT
jgi:hypothetical protein